MIDWEGNDIMTITEILAEIHRQRVELEVCQELQRWLLDDRASWIDRAMDAESTVRAIGKIAKEMYEEILSHASRRQLEPDFVVNKFLSELQSLARKDEYIK